MASSTNRPGRSSNLLPREDPFAKVRCDREERGRRSGYTGQAAQTGSQESMTRALIRGRAALRVRRKALRLREPLAGP